MSEREKLEAAIKKVRDNTNPLNGFWGDVLPLVCDAAHAHLDTLPKTVTKWRVSHDAGASTWRVADTKDEAIDSARFALVCGRQYVCINEIQVPA